jgi:pyridoxal phosphate enzyme (YggS family)
MRREVIDKDKMPSIKDNLETVLENIDKAVTTADRKDEIALVAVTKTVSHDKIIEAIKAGVKIIGENRVQEAAEKFGNVKSLTEKQKVVWHMIGHLQRNKVKTALQVFDMVQSIDRIETAMEIEKRAVNPVDILIEINSSGEETKSGVRPEGLFDLVGLLKNLTKVKLKGLMTIGPFTSDEKRIRQAFASTRQKFEELAASEKEEDIKYLSMGMSMDYRIAIEEGSNMVRVGTAIFGERRYT